MPWLRVGDTSADNPIVLEVLEHPNADERTVAELFGFVMLCAVRSTAHLTDYVVSRGTAVMAAGGSQAHATRLLELAVFAGYMEPVIETVDGKDRQRYKIVDDPEFIHMRTKEEIEWERQRKADIATPALTIPVRLRDGDGCRYCGQVVNFGARTGRLAGTYDHRHPGRKASSVDDLVVSCKRCNSGRKDNPNAEKQYPLLPAPTRPYFSASTVKQLEDSEWAASNGITIPSRPKTTIRAGIVPPGYSTPAPGTAAAGNGDAPDSEQATATSGLQSNGSVPGQASDAQATATTGRVPDVATAPDVGEEALCRDQQESARDLTTGPDRGGTGRDGVGTGRGGSPNQPPPQESLPENPPTDPPRPDDHRPGKRKRPRRRKRK